MLFRSGIATGMTVQAALLSLRQLQPASLTLAVPVLDRSVVPRLRPLVDQLGFRQPSHHRHRGARALDLRLRPGRARPCRRRDPPPQASGEGVRRTI